MPLTAEQAAIQVAAEVKRLGGWNPGNVLDAVIGVASNNSAELQALLNDLLKKKGVLSEADEAVVVSLLAQQEAERKKRQQIRTKNAIVITGITAIVGTLIFFAVKKKKGS